MPEEILQISPNGLAAAVALPASAKGLVVFAHGSGSSRLSPRNTRVARELQNAGFGTMLFDLLTEFEAANRKNVFDVTLLASRLLLATDWVARRTAARSLPIGYFGASTGAAAALIAAACLGKKVAAVVSRGGRPDLAAQALTSVVSPTLLIVGGDDLPTLEANRDALAQLTCVKQLDIVPGATHLFEEPGKLEAVVDLARQWFERHLHP